MADAVLAGKAAAGEVVSVDEFVEVTETEAEPFPALDATETAKPTEGVAEAAAPESAEAPEPVEASADESVEPEAPAKADAAEVAEKPAS